MKELFEVLRMCATMVSTITYLQSKENKTPYERSELKFKKEVLPIYLERLKRIIEDWQNKKNED